MPGISNSPTSSGWRLTNALMSDLAAGLPMESATSMVKKSEESRKRSTVSRRMWSASMCQVFFQPSSLTALAAAARTLGGSEPMMVCSRLDLFQTGTMSTPCSGRENAGPQLRLGLMRKAVAHAEGKSADPECSLLVQGFVHAGGTINDFHECRNMSFCKDE